MNLNRLKAAVALLIAAQGFAAKSDVTLSWMPATDEVITNYTLSWGTNSGVYNIEYAAGTQTKVTVTGLADNTVYYFSVTATAQDGTQSADSNEIIYTNTSATTPPATPPPATPPPAPLPPVPPAGGGTTNNANLGGGGSGGSGVSHGSGSSRLSGGAGSGSGSTGEISVPGVPPVLTLSFANQHPLLSILGTAGSTLMIQSSTNPAHQNNWITITNLAMTNPATAAATNPASPSTINLAFVPAAQKYEVINTTHPTCEFYQVVMPYDYMVLADAVLSNQGYTNRLVLVRMPGISSADVCYVAPQSSFLYYDTTNCAFALEPSGSTIRQIANTLSSWLGQNWTSASEFSYSKGVSTLLATVVETTTSVNVGQGLFSTASIQIDF